MGEIVDELTPEKVALAAKEIIRVVNEAGSARIGWVLREPNILGSLYQRDEKGNALPPKKTHLFKIVGLVIKDGEYMPMYLDDDCWILRSHEFVIQQSVLRTNRVSRRHSRVNIGIAVGTFLFIGATVLLEILDKTPEKLECIRQSLTQIDSTMQRFQPLSNNPQTIAKPDTLPVAQPMKAPQDSQSLSPGKSPGQKKTQ